VTTAIRGLTLAVALAVFVIGGFTGFRLLTADAGDASTTAPTCKDTTIAAGSELASNVVTVNVFNASTRSGLANRVRIDLQKNGFLGGEIGNSTSAAKPNRVAILTDDPDDPRVKLVAAQFKNDKKDIEYAPADVPVEDGVTVIVGDNYRGLKDEATTTVKSDRDIKVCVPVVPLP
jgi:hypothetical protein